MHGAYQSPVVRNVVLLEEKLVGLTRKSDAKVDVFRLLLQL